MNRPNRKFCLAIACILMLQFAFLASMLRHKSFTADECYELRNLDLSPFAIAADGDGFPPLFRWLLSCSITVTGESLARIFPMVTSLLGTLVIGWTGCRLCGRNGGLAGAFFFAFSACQMEYAQQLRAYSLYIFGVAIMISSFFLVVEHATPSRWAAFVASTVLTLLTHYYAVLFAAVLWGWIGWLAVRRWWANKHPRVRYNSKWESNISVRSVVVAAAIGGLFSLPFIFALRVDLAHPPPREVVNAVDFTSIAYLYLSLAQGWCVGPSSIELQSMPFQSAVLQIFPWALLSFSASGCLVMLALKGTKKGEASVLLILICFTTLIAIGLSLLLGFSFVSRYLAGLIAPVALLVCLGCQNLNRAVSWIPLAILLTVNVLSIANRNGNDRYDRENYRLLLETISKQDPAPKVGVLSHYVSYAVAKAAPEGSDITPLSFYSDDPADPELWESFVASDRYSGAWIVTEWFPPGSEMQRARDEKIAQLRAIHVMRVANSLELYRVEN